MTDFKNEGLKGRCATCKHWQGNKEKARLMFEANPKSMELFKGWPEDGPCGLEYEWLSIMIYGDAVAGTAVDANFGCIYWSAEPKEINK